MTKELFSVLIPVWNAKILKKKRNEFIFEHYPQLKSLN